MECTDGMYGWNVRMECTDWMYGLNVRNECTDVFVYESRGRKLSRKGIKNENNEIYMLMEIENQIE